MRTLTRLDRGWRFGKGDDERWLRPDFDASGWTETWVPATNLELPLNGFDETSYQFISTWLLDLELPSLESGRRAFLDFEGVMVKAEVFLNGRRAGAHIGGYTPFSIELTNLATKGRNRLAVIVDSRELPEAPPFGHVVDYLCYGGIYREVFLRIQESDYISSVFAKPSEALSEFKHLEVDIEIDRSAGGAANGQGSNDLTLSLGLREWPGLDGSTAGGATPLSPESSFAQAVHELSSSVSSVRLPLLNLAGIEPWSPEKPVLYELEILLRRGGSPIDRRVERIGWREAEWRTDGFFLNGRRLKLRGLNRHQSYPYVGYAMPERAQRRDAEILKRELGVNLVRTSHYPQSRHFLDACDELGLLVFEELPGWQHIGDRAWQDNAMADLRSMIERDRNRPSIILWGVRINESQDSHDFYLRTNALANELDPTRARGGVRYLEGSEFLEDVYTFNDFSHATEGRALRKPRAVTKLRRDVPYLVTEHNGHMFPTKRFDNEERLVEHALRHARVLDAAYGDPGIAGAIGWCAFDYTTHKDFGSGDRVCYHGVSDMFRIPKYAAWVYASQVEPAERIVLEAASLFAKGERNAAAMLPIQVWTNCDEIILHRSGARVGSYFPDRKAFPHLPHPPVVIRDLIGDRLAELGFSERDQAIARDIIAVIFSRGMEALGWRRKLRMGLLLARNKMSFDRAEELITRLAIGWGEKSDSYELVGVVGGKEVAHRVYGGDAYATRLELRPDDDEIFADGLDITRFVLSLLDQYGNIQPFATEAVELSIEGPGSIVGPRLLPLVGGTAAFWVRGGKETGEILIRARGSRFAASATIACLPSPS